ncbi:MAG: hypothetical protein Q6363_004255 [Candidatus Njordarchaeota archaeon]
MEVKIEIPIYGPRSRAKIRSTTDRYIIAEVPLWIDIKFLDNNGKTKIYVGIWDEYVEIDKVPEPLKKDIMVTVEKIIEEKEKIYTVKRTISP